MPKQITLLNSKASLVDNDLLLVKDTSDNVDKKLLGSAVKTYVKDGLLASESSNDSSVSGVSVKDALETLDLKKASYFDTFANLAAISPIENGKVFICIERANAQYVLQDSGYVAQVGDVTFANGRVGKLFVDDWVNPKWFGAKGDGVTDDTNTIQAALNAGGYVLIDSVYAVTSISIPENTCVTCTSGGKFLSIGATDSRVVTVNARVTGHLHVDGNNRSVNCIYYPEGLGYSQVFHSLEYENVTMDLAGSPIATGVTMFGDSVRGGSIYGKNMNNNGYSNVSFPQGLATGGGRYEIESHYLENGVSGFVPVGLLTGETIYNASGNVRLGTNHTVNCTDNSAYLLGGYVYIGTNIAEGIEESVQVNAVLGADIGRVVAIGRTLGAINFQNALGPVNVGEVVGAPERGIDISNVDFAGKVPTSICYTRSGNDTVGCQEITISSVKGYFQLGCLLSVGTIESFSIKDVDVVLCYKPSASPLNQWTVNPASTSWWNFSSCKRVTRKDIKVQIRNFEVSSFPAFTSGNNFSTVNRTDVDFGHIENEEFYLIENTGLETAVNHVRTSAPQDNLYYEGQYFRNISGATYSVNPQYANYQKESINGKPLSGYWYEGQVLWERDNAQDGEIYHKCIASGSPGTWITIGGIITGSGSPVGVVTPDYVSQVYRDTGTSNLWMAYGNGNTFWRQIG